MQYKQKNKKESNNPDPFLKNGTEIKLNDLSSIEKISEIINKKIKKTVKNKYKSPNPTFEKKYIPLSIVLKKKYNSDLSQVNYLKNSSLLFEHYHHNSRYLSNSRFMERSKKECFKRKTKQESTNAIQISVVSRGNQKEYYAKPKFMQYSTGRILYISSSNLKNSLPFSRNREYSDNKYNESLEYSHLLKYKHSLNPNIKLLLPSLPAIVKIPCKAQEFYNNNSKTNEPEASNPVSNLEKKKIIVLKKKKKLSQSIENLTGGDAETLDKCSNPVNDYSKVNKSSDKKNSEDYQPVSLLDLPNVVTPSSVDTPHKKKKSDVDLMGSLNSKSNPKPLGSHSVDSSEVVQPCTTSIQQKLQCLTSSNFKTSNCMMSVASGISKLSTDSSYLTKGQFDSKASMISPKSKCYGSYDVSFNSSQYNFSPQCSESIREAKKNTNYTDASPVTQLELATNKSEIDQNTKCISTGHTSIISRFAQPKFMRSPHPSLLPLPCGLHWRRCSTESTPQPHHTSSKIL